MKTLPIPALIIAMIVAAILVGCGGTAPVLAETPEAFAGRYCAAQTAIATAKAANQLLLAAGKLSAGQIAELDTAGALTMMGLEADRQARGITAPIVCPIP